MAEIKEGTLKIKIATYNIAAGRYCRDLAGICEDIKTADADIVGLQEVDMYVERSGKINMLEKIAERTGYPYSTFVRAIDYGGGEYGTAILSRYPLTRVEILPLTDAGIESERRSVAVALVDILGFELNYLNTHTAYESPKVREAQLKCVAELSKPLGSYIITGDFNTDDFSQFSVFGNGKTVNSDKNYLPSFTPQSSGIDNIIMSEDWDFYNSSLGAAGNSDHRLLSAYLEKRIN